MKKTLIIVAAIAVIVVGAVVLMGGGDTQTFSNKDAGYSFEYPSNFPEPDFREDFGGAEKYTPNTQIDAGSFDNEPAVQAYRQQVVEYFSNPGLTKGYTSGLGFLNDENDFQNEEDLICPPASCTFGVSVIDFSEQEPLAPRCSGGQCNDPINLVEQKAQVESNSNTEVAGVPAIVEDTIYAPAASMRRTYTLFDGYKRIAISISIRPSLKDEDAFKLYVEKLTNGILNNLSLDQMIGAVGDADFQKAAAEGLREFEEIIASFELI